ncbi:helix-turn-helix domain-containing protein [Mucilaginibacter phenanthrenivorans]|uniref:helix-turn-helix domain-containing protein n=1 Tax=Mucilaginibacter phenanthrenivorans TaxID=1234842 RepID=UPI00358EAA9C
MVRSILPYSKIVKKPQTKAYNPHPQTLGEHIKKRRIEANILQKDVAAIIGVSEDSVTYWENERSAPQVQHYPNIIRFLGYYPFDHETKSIAGKLKQVRYCLGLSFEACGELFLVHSTTIRSWEMKRNPPSKPTQLLITARWNSLEPALTQTQQNNESNKTI